MSRNRVDLNICGTNYAVIADEDEIYMMKIAKNVDEEMSKVMKSNKRVSVTMAAVLTALKYCDDAKKALSESHELKSKIKSYVEDSINSKLRADESEKEKIKLEKKVKNLEDLIKEYDELLEASSISDNCVSPSKTSEVLYETKYIDPNQVTMDSFAQN